MDCRTAAWFGDLGDGIHKGDENDPRVAVIEVVPDEIRYWYTTKGKFGSALDVGIGAVTGKVACPGELRTISQDEVSNFLCSLWYPVTFLTIWSFQIQLSIAK